MENKATIATTMMSGSIQLAAPATVDASFPEGNEVEFGGSLVVVEGAGLRRRTRMTDGG